MEIKIIYIYKWVFCYSEDEWLKANCLYWLEGLIKAAKHE